MVHDVDGDDEVNGHAEENEVNDDGDFAVDGHYVLRTPGSNQVDVEKGIGEISQSRKDGYEEEMLRENVDTQDECIATIMNQMRWKRK